MIRIDRALRIIVVACAFILCVYIGVGVDYLISVAGGL